MGSSRIRNPDLAAQIDEGELAWLRYVSPITEHYAREIARRDYRGKRLAFWWHITPQNMLPVLALKQAGAEMVMGACNVDSTNDAVAAYIAAQGIRVYGWQGMSQSEYDENMTQVRSFEALAPQERRCSFQERRAHAGISGDRTRSGQGHALPGRGRPRGGRRAVVLGTGGDRPCQGA